MLGSHVFLVEFERRPHQRWQRHLDAAFLMEFVFDTIVHQGNQACRDDDAGVKSVLNLWVKVKVVNILCNMGRSTQNTFVGNPH